MPAAHWHWQLRAPCTQARPITAAKGRADPTCPASFLLGFLHQRFHLATVRSRFVFIPILVPPSPTCVPGAAAQSAAPPRRPGRAQAPLPLLGGWGREGGSPPSTHFSPGIWFPSRGRSRSPVSAPPPCPEGRCAAALLHSLLSRELQRSTIWTGGAGSSLLRPFPSSSGDGGGEHRALSSRLGSGAEGRRPGSWQAAVSDCTSPRGP